MGRNKFDFPCNIRLTDSRFHISSDIDLLIGAEFWNLICIKSNLQTSTQLSRKHDWGEFWRVVWAAPYQPPQKFTGFRNQCGITRTCQSSKWTYLHKQTMEENICERHFLDNVSQNSQDRYALKLPVRKQMLNNIGDSQFSSDWGAFQSRS